ncbi:MAG TPA: hypothetical protein VHI78_00740 [Bacteroidales bacterium]|jgi:hypothetical protein|nr:hypothetical protein [Bacteroidales bacterium]
MKPKILTGVVVLMLSNLFYSSNCQNYDSTRTANRFGVVVTLTTKGISTVPNLTLGKPAVMFDMRAGKKLTFEPQFRFALEGKPWSFLFWWRYNLLSTQKFRLNIGMHPAISFRTVTDTTSEMLKEYIRADRYLAGEVSPAIVLSKNISIGMYYLYSRGLEKHITRNTHLISFRTGISVNLSDKFYTRLTPQIYYLIMDQYNGYYFNSSLVAGHRDFPLSVSFLINKAIETHIPVGEDFLWNASLIYSFNAEYARKR